MRETRPSATACGAFHAPYETNSAGMVQPTAGALALAGPTDLAVVWIAGVPNRCGLGQRHRGGHLRVGRGGSRHWLRFADAIDQVRLGPRPAPVGDFASVPTVRVH